MSVGIRERLDSPEEQQRSAIESYLANLRVAMPGIIISFNPENQTATVQPAITENIQIGNAPSKAEEIPVLSDVPVQFPRAGGYCITFPVKKGDECLLVFGDMCIDGWWQSGGVQGQMETRRHDLSDAFAIIGVTSVPNAVKDYSHNTLQIKKEGGGGCIEIDGNHINISCPGQVSVSGEKIGVNSGNVDINTTGNISISGGNVSIQGRDFLEHTHNGVQPGGGTTGGVK